MGNPIIKRFTILPKRIYLVGFVLQWLLLAEYSNGATGPNTTVATGPIPPQKKIITVGYLYSDQSKGWVKNKQGRIISGAMTLAIQTINRHPTVLKDVELRFIISDTWADTLNGTRALTHQWRQGAVAFFGPDESCEVEARVAASWNLPMLSYVSIINIHLDLTMDKTGHFLSRDGGI